MNTQSPGPGHNEAPDYAQLTADQLTAEYGEVFRTVEELLATAAIRDVPVKSDEDALENGALIKRLRDIDNRLENVRVVEGEPFLRRWNAVNSLFFGWRDKIGKRNKTDRKAQDGALDRLQSRNSDWQNWKLAEARRKLAEEQAAAERVAAAARAKAAEEARRAEEARLAAERARLEETRAAKGAVADAQEGAAAGAAVDAQIAERAAEDARLAALAKPADLTRLRGTDQHGAGVTLTMKQEPYAIMVDRTKLDLRALLPFFRDEELEKALRQWAKTTGHRVQMDGAEIGFRNAGVTR